MPLEFFDDWEAWYKKEHPNYGKPTIMSIPPSVTITDEELGALKNVIDFFDLSLEKETAMCEDDMRVSDTARKLLNKLLFAQDNKLRLSGKMRVINVEKAGQPLSDEN